MGLEPASIGLFTLSNMNISKTSRPNEIKFHLGHHWGGGKAAYNFRQDRIRTLVSMATDSSHRVIMGNILSPFLTGSSSFLQIMSTNIKSRGLRS